MSDHENKAAEKIQKFWLRMKYKNMLKNETRKEFEGIVAEFNDVKPKWKSNFCLPIFDLPNEYETLIVQSAIAQRLAVLKYKK